MRLITLLCFVFISSAMFAQNIDITPEYLSGLGDKKSYKLVLKENSVQYCETFLEAYPKSKYKKKVNLLYDKLFYIAAYDTATKTFELNGLREYLKKFPNGIYKSKAEETIDIMSWQKAKAKNTREAIQEYIDKFPQGRAVPLAKKLLESL